MESHVEDLQRVHGTRVTCNPFDQEGKPRVVAEEEKAGNMFISAGTVEKLHGQGWEEVGRFVGFEKMFDQPCAAAFGCQAGEDSPNASQGHPHGGEGPRWGSSRSCGSSQATY